MTGGLHVFLFANVKTFKKEVDKRSSFYFGRNERCCALQMRARREICFPLKEKKERVECLHILDMYE